MVYKRVVLATLLFLNFGNIWSAVDTSEETKQSSSAKDKVKAALNRIKFLGKYTDSEIGIQLIISDSVKVELKYNLGFSGAGDMDLGFPAEVRPRLYLTLPTLGTIPVELNELTAKLTSLGVKELTTVVRQLDPLQGKYLLFVKLGSLLSQVAYNKVKKNLTFPQGDDVLVEINKLILREMKTPGAESLTALLNDMPDALKNALNQVEVPNLLDRGVVAGNNIKLLTFLDNRFGDIRSILTKKYEFDVGYTPDLSNQQYTPYQIVQHLFALFYRAQKDASSVLPLFLNTIKDTAKRAQLANEVEKNSGKEKRAQMGAVIKEYSDAQQAYSKLKNAITFKNYQVAKLKLYGFIILFFVYERAPGKMETIQDFIVREIKRIIPRSPGFDKIAPLLDSVLKPLGLSVDALLGKEQLPPEPPMPAGEDPLLELDVEPENLDF